MEQQNPPVAREEVYRISVCKITGKVFMTNIKTGERVIPEGV